MEFTFDRADYQVDGTVESIVAWKNKYNSFLDKMGNIVDDTDITFVKPVLAPTAAAGTNTTQLATTAFVTTSPVFTGTPTAPTAAAGTSTTQLATTAFVTAADNLSVKKGDFLLGATAPYISDANVITTTQWNSVGAVWNGSPFSGTVGSNQGYLFTQVWENVNYRLQTFYNVNYSFVSAWRRMDNGAWSSWVFDWTYGTSNGHVLIGTTTDNGVDKLQVNGSISAATASAGTNTTQLATTAFVVGEKGGRRNYLINGNFDKWDYGASQTVTGYYSDNRWMSYSTGSTKTHSQVVCGDTERALFNAVYFSRTIVNSVAGSSNYTCKVQRIENVALLAGKTVTLSFWAKADGNKNIAIQIGQGLGSGGTPSGGGGTAISIVPLTTTWQKNTVTMTLPSIVGKTLGTDGIQTTFSILYFFFEAAFISTLGQQSGMFDIAQVKLEDGSVATNGWHPYDGEFGGEVEACARYLNKFTGLSGNFGAYAQGAYMTYQLSYPTMRTVPSITSSLSNTTYASAENLHLDTQTTNTARLVFDATAAATNANFVMGSGDYFMLSAEL
jgi:hypothetical protein